MNTHRPPWFLLPAITLCTLLVFTVPIVVVGPPIYPDSGWRGVALWSVVAAVVGLAANRSMVAQRKLTATADARAEQLDRLVATQTAIATSPFDLEAVLASVVTEAQRLSGADAAVVELPDGDELVYRAAAGAAEPFTGLRLPRDAALSGLALQRRTILVCRDSESDPRVDREAARAVGSRSMIVVPLLHEGGAIGVLKVYSERADAFADDDSKVLSLLATIIGTALARAELMAKLSEQAVTDDLTGLPNRRAWTEQLAHAVARCRRSGQPLSVVLLDLDEFKQVNDRDGHAAGDRLLRAIAGAWSGVLRGTDILGRLGGDEFAVILEGADSLVAEEVVGRLERVLPSGQTASAGVATWNHVEDQANLIARADAEMYERKRAGFGRAAGAEVR
jgi:diguanylate cyclase (GGDEF)-like protein